MNTMRVLTTTALIAAVTVASAQQTQRLRRMIEMLIKSSSGGAPVTVSRADNAVVVSVLKASVANIKEGSSVGSGAMPQPDGTHLTNVGQAVSSVDGSVVTVKYKDGEKKIIVGPTVPIVRYEVGDKSELKPGAAINIAAATNKPDGTFSTARINVGRNGLVR